MYQIDEIRNKILCGDVIAELKKIPNDSIDCIVTSPPYWKLRSYLPNDHPDKSKELGSEKTLDEYIENMLAVLKELKRVLKPTGVIWWNHGDSYASTGSQFDKNKYGGKSGIHCGRARTKDILSKSLCLQNYRLIIRACDELGIILRDIPIWAKKLWVANTNTCIGNAMPSSVNSRCANSYEPIFMLVKSNKPNYYYNIKTGIMQKKKPLGINGREDKDWEYQDCPACTNPDYFNVRVRDTEKDKFAEKISPSEIARKYGYDPEGICPICGRTWKGHASPDAKDRIVGLKREFIPCIKQETKIPEEQAENFGSPRARYHRNKDGGNCTRCGNTGKVKQSLWRSVDYWFDIDTLRVEYTETSLDRIKYPVLKYGGDPNNPLGAFGKGIKSSKNNEMTLLQDMNPSGANRPNVWNVNTENFSGEHYATFPQRLISDLIRSSCPQEVCKFCGLPRTRITKSEQIIVGQYQDKGKVKSILDANDTRNVIPRARTGLDTRVNYQTIAWSHCQCENEDNKYSPGIVLDPFAGAMTTPLVSKNLIRSFIAIELNPHYCKLGQQRIENHCGNLFGPTEVI